MRKPRRPGTLGSHLAAAPSQSHCLAADVLVPRLQRSGGHQIHRDTERLFDFLPHRRQVEKSNAGAQIHEQVNVAVIAIIATSDRTEYTDLGGTMAGRNLAHLSRVLSQYFRWARSKGCSEPLLLHGRDGPSAGLVGGNVRLAHSASFGDLLLGEAVVYPQLAKFAAQFRSVHTSNIPCGICEIAGDLAAECQPG